MKKIILTLSALILVFGVFASTLKVKAADAPELIDGAQIRTDSNAGMKFVANATPVDGATYGMVIARGELTDLTVETAGSVKGETNTLNANNQFYLTMVSFPEFAYVQDLTVRAYVLVDGVYTYSENIVTRNIAEVAIGAKDKGTTGDFIDAVANYTYQNYRKVHKDIHGNVYVDNALYETNHKKLAKAFIEDWNTLFETTLDAETAFVQGDNYASPFRSSARNNSTTDPEGAKIATFFRNEAMYAKWGWILDYIQNELSAGTAFDPCVTQINCIKNNTTDESGNWYYGITLVSYLQSIFNAKGTSTGSGRFSFEKEAYMSKLGLIANYNNKVLADLSDVTFVKKGSNVSLDVLDKDGYVFNGYTANGLTYNDSYTTSDEQIMFIPSFTEAVVTYDFNGGSFLYGSLDEAIEDYINDFNTFYKTETSYNGTQYTPETFAALGAWEQPIGSVSNMLYNATYKDKWAWLVNYIATVAVTATNKEAFTNFYNYTKQSELNSADSNYIYCVAYELRGFAGQVQYTKNSNFKSADYSSATIKNALNTIIQTPVKDGYEFAGWKSSIDGSVTTTFPGYETDVPVTYTAQWREKAIYVDPTATTGSVYEVNGAKYVYGTDLFATINDAITAASEGDTIRLVPGTHSADVTISKANITIAGPNEGIPYNGTRNEEAIISGTISVSANNFTLDGVKFSGTQIKATKALSGLNILNAILTGKGALIQDSGGRHAVLGSNYNLSDLVIKYSSIDMPSSQSGKNGLAFYGVVTNANIENNNFENTLALSTYTEAILLNKVAGEIYVLNNNINWSTDNYSIFLGSGSNAATVVEIRDNVVNCTNTTYYTAGIAVRNIASGVTVNIVGNKIYNMGGNTFNFKSSVSGANVNISYNYFDVNTSFKLTDFGSATVTTNNNCYEGGITSAGHNPDTSTETTYANLSELESAYAKVK